MTNLTNSIRNRHIIAAFFYFFCCLQACQTKQRDQQSQNFSQPDTLRVKYAQNFELLRYPDYTVIKVEKAFTDSQKPLYYVLSPEDLNLQELPPEYAQATFIRTPVQALLTSSLTHIPFVDKLEKTNCIKGHAGTAYLAFSPITQRLEAGKVQEIGQAEQLNREIILQLAPATLMLSGLDQKRYQALMPLQKAGVEIFVNSEWRENHPLGRAEWLLVFGLLLERYEQAQKAFASIEKHYQTLRKKTTALKNKPSVLTELPYKGTWYVPGGKSYMAQLIAHAGGRYAWQDNEQTGSLPLDFETVFAKAQKADFWLKTGTVTRREEMIALNKRFGDFVAWQKGTVYNNNRRLNAQGGNDYWVNGVLNPDIILADMIKILHPELMPSHQLFYFQKVK